MAVLPLLVCAPRISLTDKQLPVIPGDDLAVKDADTTVVGTVTMLSDKLQALDVVEIRGDWAERRGRFLLNKPVKPYHGGVIHARIEPTGRKVYGYIHSANLLEFKEVPLYTGQAVQNTVLILDKQRLRFERLLRKAGFDGWDGENFIDLEGYDPGQGIVIYSMAGGALNEGNLIKKPVLVIWASPEGEILKLRLITVTQFLERG